MPFLLSACLLVAAVIHLMPLAGALGAQRLTDLYGIPVAEPNLELLLRHRAVLFGLLGGFFAYAAFRPEMQPAALIMGLISVVSFLVLAYSIGGINPRIARVVSADWVALTALAVGAVLSWRGAGAP